MAYAIIRTGGKQYRVSEGDIIDVEKLALEPGAEAVFEEVLFHTDGENVQNGAPALDGARVTGVVMEQRKGSKVIAFKFRRRKGYHRTVGHRQKLTRVKIKAIEL